MAYVPRMSSVGLTTLAYYNRPPNPFTPLRIHANCTTYAYGRWLEIANGDTSKFGGLFGSPVGSRWGGAWYAASPTLQAGKRNPQQGDIMCWRYGDRNPYDGHVAVVEKVYSDYVVASASYYGSNKLFNTEDMPLSTDYRSKWLRDYGARFQGFIRMGGTSGGVVPSIPMPTEWMNTIDKWPTEDEMINNSVMAYVKLNELGWSFEAICGAIGNFRVESGVNPGMREIGNHNNGGLVGWTPLTKWSVQANIEGVPWNDGDAQIEWIDSGCYWSGSGPHIYHGPDSHWDDGSLHGAGMSYSQFKETTTETPEEMARLFMRGYEKPLNYERPGGGMIALRQEWARKMYDYLQGINLVDLIRPDTLKRPIWYSMGAPYDIKLY